MSALLRIGRARANEPGGVVEALLACHARIRSFSQLALVLVTTRGAPAGEISDAAARVERYFRVALPLHVEDEERSIRPRLLAAGVVDPGGEIARALDAMSAQHVDIDGALEALLPRWAAIARDAAALDEGRAELHAATARLCAAFEAHLAGEEAWILPAVKASLAREHESIAREMQLRRAPADLSGTA